MVVTFYKSVVQLEAKKVKITKAIYALSKKKKEIKNDENSKIEISKKIKILRTGLSKIEQDIEHTKKTLKRIKFVSVEP